jgi:lambda repressor-like predicted transcriptional regulator
MLSAAPHPEEIKAALRIKHGSLYKFEKKADLPRKSVADVLRGRAVAKTAEAIAKDLGRSVQELFPGRFKSSDLSDSSTRDSAVQHLIAEAK